MEKNTFLGGAFVVTIGIIVCKIIGVLYVIPFYSLIGDSGGALYSYAYSIYAIFLSLSSTGIPLAISKIVSEYLSMGLIEAKNRTYIIGKKIIFFVGFISFLILFLFSKKIAILIIGGVSNQNNIDNISLAIKAISFALLIVPSLSVAKGYVQGYKYMNIFSISNVIEQVVRVLIILIGSFLTIKIFHLSTEIAVIIAISGATIGAIISYLYIRVKIPKEKEVVYEYNDYITNKHIIKKIICYTIPFIVIDLMKSFYSMVDTFTLVRGMNSLGYSVIEAEKVISILSTWGSKLNNIIISFAIGLTISIIPNISSLYIKKEYKEISTKINDTLIMLLLIIVPITLFTCIFADPIWSFFYGYDEESINLFKIYVFQALSFSFFTVLINVIQTINSSKITIYILIITFILKLGFNIPIMNLFSTLNLSVYYGSVLLTIIIHLITIIFILIYLKRKINVNYKKVKNILFKYIICFIIITFFINLIRQLFDINFENRIECILIIFICFFILFFIYLFILYKLNIIDNVFKNKFIKIKRKMHKNINKTLKKS